MKKQKLLACLLAMTCVIGTLSGCGSEEKGTATSNESSTVVESNDKQSQEEVSSEVVEETGVTYPLEGDNKLTIALTADTRITAHYDSLGETPFGQAWQEQTGVELVFEEYADNQAMALMMASGELPDIILYDFSGYNGGAAKAIEDKIIEPLNDYLEYTPDLLNALAMEENFMRDVTTDNGDIIGFPNIKEDSYLSVLTGFVVREDFLEAVDMEAPVTADDLYEVLKAFKEELNIEYPLSIRPYELYNLAMTHGSITSPFGLVKGDWYVKDGKVHFGFGEEEYKGLLEYLHKLYAEGLMDNNFATMDSATMRSNFMNGLSGVTYDIVGSGVGGYVNTMKDDPDFKVLGFGSLVANEGDTAMSGQYEARITNTYAVITTQCENKELAAKFLNYGYSEEGFLLMNYGIEGVSYEMVDGKPIYTEVITANEDGYDIGKAMTHYCRTLIQTPMVQAKGYGEQYFSLPEQIQCKTVWSQNDAEKYLMPNVTIADADLDEYNKIMSDVNTFLGEMFVKYVNGTADLANFETEFLGTLNEMELERAIEIKQAAYDSYMAR